MKQILLFTFLNFMYPDSTIRLLTSTVTLEFIRKKHSA